MTDVVKVSVSKVTRRGVTKYRVRAWIDGVRETRGEYDTKDEAEAAAEAIRQQYADHPGALTLGAWAEQRLRARETDGKHRAAANDRGFQRGSARMIADAGSRVARGKRPGSKAADHAGTTRRSR